MAAKKSETVFFSEPLSILRVKFTKRSIDKVHSLFIECEMHFLFAGLVTLIVR